MIVVHIMFMYVFTVTVYFIYILVLLLMKPDVNFNELLVIVLISFYEGHFLARTIIPLIIR